MELPRQLDETATSSQDGRCKIRDLRTKENIKRTSCSKKRKDRKNMTAGKNERGRKSPERISRELKLNILEWN